MASSSQTSSPTSIRSAQHLSPATRSGPYAQPSGGSSGSTSVPRSNGSHVSHPGCVLCSIISTSLERSMPRHTASQLEDARSPSPTATTSFLAAPSRRSSTVEVEGREVVYWDEEITVYRAAGKERLCSDGRHLIVAMNRHVEGVYDLGPSDVPVLSHMLDTARQILSSASTAPSSDTERASVPDIRVGFVGTITRDPQSPHKHLHAHAMAGPVDTSLPGAGFYRRNVVFGSMNWWSIEDLRAEIRETTSNNRVKSGYAHRSRPPIDRVPDAGSKVGLPNAIDTDNYANSSPISATQTLHPNDARDGRDGRYRDRKGKGSTVPRKPVPLDMAGRPSEDESAASGAMDRKVSMSSNGSVTGDDDGYVAVNLEDRRASR